MRTRSTFDLSGRHALVTGASRGIGKAIALALAEHGAHVAIHGAARRDDAQAVADQLAALGRKTGVIIADLAEDDAPRRIVNEAIKLLGQVDILVSNASVQIRKPWADITRAEFDQQVTVNLRAAWELIQLSLPGMIERRWGRVLTIGSVQEFKANPKMLVYAATKCAQTSMVQNLAKQVAPFGVTVNNLAPGVIETERNASALSDPNIYEQLRNNIPVGFIGQPDDCAGASVLLCSEAGRYITGANLVVDGGLSL